MWTDTLVTLSTDFTTNYAQFLPWLGGGFVAGLVACVLGRTVTGIDRRRREELLALETKLAEMQNAAAAIASNNARLESELAQANYRASVASRLEDEVKNLRALGERRQSALDVELAGVREELETQRSTAQYFEDEISRLAAKSEEAGKTAYAQLSEMTALVSDLNARLSLDDASREAEIADLRAQVAAGGQGIDIEMHESEVATLMSTIKDLRRELSAVQHTQ